MADENPLRVVIARVENPGPAMGSVAASVRGAIRLQFETGGSAFGSPWAPDAVDRAIAATLGGRPLVASGDLMRSLTHGDQEVSGDGRTLVIGTDHPGALPAQFGTSHEPRREIVTDAMLDAIGEEIADQLGDFILEGLL